MTTRVPIRYGGTGANSASAARTALGVPPLAAYDVANSASSTANAAYSQANAAYAQANSAYNEANLKLNIVGGTITGNLVVQGNLEVLGNSTTLNVETLLIEDNQLVLNSNVAGSPTLDAYITINRGSNTNAELKWDENTDQWKWSDGDNVFYAFDTALDAYSQANSAYDQANTATSAVASAANTVSISQNSAGTLYAKQLNLVNSETVLVTVADAGGGVANVSFVNTQDREVSLNLSNGVDQLIDSFSSTAYRSAKYQIQAYNGFGVYASEIMIIHNDLTANAIKFGTSNIGGNVGVFTTTLDTANNLVKLIFNSTVESTYVSFTRNLLKSEKTYSALPVDLMEGSGTIDLMGNEFIVPYDLNDINNTVNLPTGDLETGTGTYDLTSDSYTTPTDLDAIFSGSVTSLPSGELASGTGTYDLSTGEFASLDLNS